MDKLQEWHELNKALLNEDLKSIKFSNPFYRRLLLVLYDQDATNIDKLCSYRDALNAAPQGVGRQLPFGLIVEPALLIWAGLSINAIGSRVSLALENVDDEAGFDGNLEPVYQLQKRRYIHRYPMDPALSIRLNNPAFTDYQGKAQQMAVRMALLAEKDDTLLINLPTGVGKTLIAHAITAFSLPHQLTLVIVPTTGLAIDQGHRAGEMLSLMGKSHSGHYYWRSKLEPQIQQDIKERIRNGKQIILFASPESACSSLLPALFEAASNNKLANIVIDEAHLVDQWGVEFRPAFQKFAAVVNALKKQSKSGIKTCLFSATYTENSLNILGELFSIKSKVPIEIHGSFLRPEIQYHVKRIDNKELHAQFVLDAVRDLPKPLILYTVTLDSANNTYDALKAQGYGRVKKFTGATEVGERESIIKAWQQDNLDIIVATSAFGVGMDKNNIRSILHVEVPENIDRFYQEVGRAGRDGNACQSLLVYRPQSIVTAERLNSKRLISVDLGHERWTTLWNHGSASVDGKRLINLRQYHQNLNRDSDHNEAWNWRTLLLMQRAGMIEIEFSAPQQPEWNPNQDLVEYQSTLKAYYEDYYKQILVSPLVDDHTSFTRWEKDIGEQRESEKRHQSRSFDVLKGWILSPEEIPLCQVLTNFYTIRYHQPELACGGCPCCRKTKPIEEFFPSLGCLVYVQGFTPASEWVPPISITESHHSVYYPVEKKSSARGIMRQWSDWIARLIEQRAISVIRAEKSYIDALQSYLPKGLKHFWIAESLQLSEQDEPYWPTLLLVPPEANTLPLLEWGGAPQILFAPETLPDPMHYQCYWWERNHRTQSLNNFLMSLNYGHH
jgi:ATP-dependent DNA helicase RecQ